MSTEESFDRSCYPCGEAGDIIATAQSLISAGYQNHDPDSIQAGIDQWSTVWPRPVVEQVTILLLQDMR